MARLTLCLFSLIFLQGCATTWDVIQLPSYDKPYKVYSSSEHLNTWTEVAAGSVLIENSQVFLSAKQEWGVASAGSGFFYSTSSMDVDNLDIAKTDATLSIKFDKLLADEISHFSKYMKTVLTKKEADIVILPSATLFNVGNGISYLHFTLAVRYIDPVSKKETKKYFTWVDENARKLNGSMSWSSQGAKKLTSETKLIIPLLVEAFFSDLDQGVGSSLNVDEARRVYIKIADMPEPLKTFVIKDKGNYLVTYKEAIWDKPMRNSILLFPKKLIVEKMEP